VQAVRDQAKQEVEAALTLRVRQKEEQIGSMQRPIEDHFWRSSASSASSWTSPCSCCEPCSALPAKPGTEKGLCLIRRTAQDRRRHRGRPPRDTDRTSCPSDRPCGTRPFPGCPLCRYSTAMTISRADGFIDPCIPTRAPKSCVDRKGCNSLMPLGTGGPSNLIAMQTDRPL
jgi:hypothetical protein